MKVTRITSVIALIAMCFAISACSSRHRNSTSQKEPWTRTKEDKPVVAQKPGHPGHPRNHGNSGKRWGPPPHAPAHGYRHKHGDTLLSYDSQLKVYIVVGWPNHYFYDGYYYRSINDTWQMTAFLDEPWQSVPMDKLPKGLRKPAGGAKDDDGEIGLERPNDDKKKGKKDTSDNEGKGNKQNEPDDEETISKLERPNGDKKKGDKQDKKDDGKGKDKQDKKDDGEKGKGKQNKKDDDKGKGKQNKKDDDKDKDKDKQDKKDDDKDNDKDKQNKKDDDEKDEGDNDNKK